MENPVIISSPYYIVTTNINNRTTKRFTDVYFKTETNILYNRKLWELKNSVLWRVHADEIFN